MAVVPARLRGARRQAPTHGGRCSPAAISAVSTMPSMCWQASWRRSRRPVGWNVHLPAVCSLTTTAIGRRRKLRCTCTPHVPPQRCWEKCTAIGVGISGYLNGRSGSAAPTGRIGCSPTRRIESCLCTSSPGSAVMARPPANPAGRCRCGRNATGWRSRTWAGGSPVLSVCCVRKTRAGISGTSRGRWLPNRVQLSRSAPSSSSTGTLSGGSAIGTRRHQGCGRTARVQGHPSPCRPRR